MMDVPGVDVSCQGNILSVYHVVMKHVYIIVTRSSLVDKTGAQ